MKKKIQYSPYTSSAEAAYTNASDAEMTEQAASSLDEQTFIEEQQNQATQNEESTSSSEEMLPNKAQEYLEALQRERAEFNNYKKRVERDQLQFRHDAVGNVVKRYLPIIDDLERAIKNRPEGVNHNNWAAGIELIYQKMVSALEADSIKPIGEVGDLFDPTMHEAIGQAESEGFESGQIIDVLQKGYLIGEKVLRPALVRVAA